MEKEERHKCTSRETIEKGGKKCCWLANDVSLFLLGEEEEEGEEKRKKKKLASFRPSFFLSCQLTSSFSSSSSSSSSPVKREKTMELLSRLLFSILLPPPPHERRGERNERRQKERERRPLFVCSSTEVLERGRTCQSLSLPLHFSSSQQNANMKREGLREKSCVFFTYFFCEMRVFFSSTLCRFLQLLLSFLSPTSVPPIVKSSCFSSPSIH